MHLATPKWDTLGLKCGIVQSFLLIMREEYRGGIKTWVLQCCWVTSVRWSPTSGRSGKVEHHISEEKTHRALRFWVRVWCQASLCGGSWSTGVPLESPQQMLVTPTPTYTFLKSPMNIFVYWFNIQACLVMLNIVQEICCMWGH